MFLHTAANSIVSLYHVFDFGSDRNVLFGKPAMQVGSQHFIAHTAVVGPDKWTPTDSVRRVTFRIEHTDGLLRHKEKVRNLSKLAGHEPRTLLDLHANGIRLLVGYTCKYSFWSDDPQDIRPIFEIEFDCGVGLDRYLDYVTCVVELFSAAAGVRLWPSEISVSRLS